MPIDDEPGATESPGNGTPAGPATSNAALGLRFQQMFPVLAETEFDDVRRFGEDQAIRGRRCTSSTRERPFPGCT